MTLRARLVLALLVMALAPSCILTLFSLDQINRAIQRWYRPGVDRALESALEATKTPLTRMEMTAVGMVQDWSAVDLASPAKGAGAEQDRAAIQRELERAGLDFFQTYRRTETGWALAEQVTPPGMMAVSRKDLSAEFPPQLDGAQVLHSKQGTLAAISSAGGGGAVASGFWLSPDYFEQVDRVTQGATHYRRLGVYVDVQRSAAAVLVGIVVLLLAALAIPLAGRLARQISRPLGELSAAMEDVATGNLDARVQPSGAAELKSLGVSFNAMAGRLAAARDAQQRAEREAAWRDVARKLAHEFKNILTPMKLSLQLLECQIQPLATEREPRNQNLEAALREVGSLDRLATQFAQYARLPEPHLEPLDLAEVARAAAALEPEAKVQIHATDGVARVRGDRLLLSRAVHNLLRNAWEAAPRTAVELHVGADRDQAWIEVLDRGPGLPPGSAEQWFEPYTSTKKRGSGLGLSLVRDIAGQHGGSVSLGNRDGGGARARLVVPRATEEAVPA